MQPKFGVVVFLVALLFLPFLFCDARRESFAGQWKPIKDINDPRVRNVAEFAVWEYRKQSKESLKLDSVVKGEMQVVSGINYKLDVKTSNGTMGDDKEYEAVVWEKTGLLSKNLTLLSFTPIQG